MATKKITKLTAEQEAALVEYRAQWLSIGMSTERADRATAERAITAMYAEIGKPAPQFLWLSSPAVSVLAAGVLRGQLGGQLGDQLWDQLRGQLMGQLRDQLMGQLRDQLMDQLRGQLRDQLMDQLGGQLWGQLGGQLWDQLWDQLMGQLRDQLMDQLRGQLRDQLRGQLGGQLWGQLGGQLGDQLWDQLWDQLMGQLRDQLMGQLRGQLRDQLWGQLGGQLGDQLYRSLWGQHEAYWIAYYLYPRDTLGVTYPERWSHILDLWADVSRSCGWWWPHEGIVIASERPTVQTLDERGLLHNESGPSIGFSDGYAVYGWHGVRVPQRVIEQPESITAQEILSESNAEIRRVMLERVGVERFMREASPTVLHEDVDGAGQPRKLLSIDLPNDPDRRMVAVHVQCPSTGHEYMLRVPPTVKRCDQAVAWTYGLEAKEYAPLVER